MAIGLDSTKAGNRPSHDAIDSTNGPADVSAETKQERLDQDAMDGAKRAQDRIHDDEVKNPGTSIFTK
jgi:hypothetical protein